MNDSGIHLSPPGHAYSPPLDTIRINQQIQQQQQQQQQQHLVAYSDSNGAIKYTSEVSVVPTESLKAPSTYTNLDPVPLSAPTSVPYTQYIATSEGALQQAPCYTYAKSQEILYSLPASSQAPREVRIHSIYTF